MEMERNAYFYGHCAFYDNLAYFLRSCYELCAIAWIVKWIVDERKLHKVWEVKPMKFDVEMPRVGTKIEFQSRFSRTEHELWSDQSYSDTQISRLTNIFNFYKLGQDRSN